MKPPRLSDCTHGHALFPYSYSSISPPRHVRRDRGADMRTIEHLTQKIQAHGGEPRGMKSISIDL